MTKQKKSRTFIPCKKCGVGIKPAVMEKHLKGIAPYEKCNPVQARKRQARLEKINRELFK